MSETGSGRSIERYLRGEFSEGSSRLEETHITLIEIARFFSGSYDTDLRGWHYEFPLQSRGGDYSVSTQAMCALSLTRLTRAAFWHKRENKEQVLRELVRVKTDDCVTALCAKLRQNVEQGGPLWQSRTYGSSNPLTAGWLAELVSEGHECIDSAVGAKLADIVYDALVGEFVHIIGEDNRAGAHAFPVYRLVSVVTEVQRNGDRWHTSERDWNSVLRKAGNWFEQELHKQLSHHHFSDFRFDAPELIYSLAGALKTGRLSRQDALIPDVLAVITAAQERSVYWRPYRPFVVKPEGLALMPLSVEVADALLDICQMIDDSDQLDKCLAKYHKWLMTQKELRAAGDDSSTTNVTGWRSENAFGPVEICGIHTWSTSRVALFLLNYSRMLDLTLQRGLLRNSGLSIKRTEALTPLEKIKPMDRGRENRVLELMKKHFIAPHKSSLPSTKQGRLDPRGSFSMFLYGPPGTSKTSICEGLARELDIPLVTITVSDFIELGVEAVEQRAKTIFAVLGALKNVVVLFDEIDRLITDRDSGQYHRQGDVLQLMTPSMLTKLNDLRRSKQLVFVISTNYFERVDKAIRRPGRIDHHFLIPPFDQDSRVALLTDFVSEWLVQNGKEIWTPTKCQKKRLASIARKGPLLIFEELRRVVDRSVGSGVIDIEEVLMNLDNEIQEVTPSINEKTYERRLKRVEDDGMVPERPYVEFFFMCFILAEVDQASDELKELCQEKWNEWKKYHASEATALASDRWVAEQMESLALCPPTPSST